MTKFCGYLLILVFAGFCQACTHVEVWQRGNLARKDMSLEPTPNLSHIRQHIFTSREAAQGGGGGSGGGCGCN